MFKIKDLMIKVIPDDAERMGNGPVNVGACGTSTCGCSDTCGSCSWGTCFGCSQCSPPSGGSFQRGEEVINPSDLFALKADLKRRLAIVEAMESSLAPKTVQEVEVLEKKLTTALAELKHIKAKLTK